MKWPRKKQNPPRVSETVRSTVHMGAALLLDYPGDDFDERMAAVDVEARALPEEYSTLFAAFLDEARGRGTQKLAEHYVQTFDQRRRCTQYLSFYSAGDTRRRGAAILAFKEAQKACGWGCDDELPDFLPVVLELSSRTDGEIAEGLLNAHREGLEMMQVGLDKVESPYRHLILAVRRTLPEIDSEVRERVLGLISQGPPTELVGITDLTLTPTPFPLSEETRA